MKKVNISEQLKKMRIQRGLSQSELARRVGTSVPTISRYENYWKRFELYTLDKLATALGCRLRIELEPVDGGRYTDDRRGAIARLGRLFWDRELLVSDFEEYPRWVIKRVLEYGAWDDVQEIFRIYGKKKLLDNIAAINFGSVRTSIFWKAMLKQEGRPCMKKRFQREVLKPWHS